MWLRVAPQRCYTTPLQWDNVGGLQPLRALLDAEFDPLAFVECLETLALDAGVVDKDVTFVTLARDESVALGVAEPLDCTLFSLAHRSQLYHVRTRASSHY